MGKFILGIVLGAAFAFGYVYLGWRLPAALELPERFKGNVISSATEAALYDFKADAETRRRALEVYFANRAIDAATLDAEAGHPFLSALEATRARREARQLKGQWAGFDEMLAQPALKAALERKHGTSDAQALKLAMLLDGLEERPFLKAWLEMREGPVSAASVYDMLSKAARDP